MTRLYKRFCTKCDPLPQSAFIEEVRDSFELFAKLPWGDWWNCGNMKSVFMYLRGSTDLQLGPWRPLFPTYLEVDEPQQNPEE